MRGTLDRQADAAYVHLVDDIPPGGARRQVVVEGENLNAMIVLDLDSAERLLGIEIIGATRILHQDTLAAFERVG